MDFSVVMSNETPWRDLLDLSRHIAAGGWHGIYFPDHLAPPARDQLQPVPIHEAWTTLAALSASVPRVRLGHLVSCNNYRHPALLAKMAATVDEISGGRLVLGLGAGWQENEHRAYGIPFLTKRERMERLAETCQIVRSLFARPMTTFAGRHYQLEDAPLDPKPMQPHLPLLIGAWGRLGLELTARYADEWEMEGTPETFAKKRTALESNCVAIGRDPSEIRRSVHILTLHTPSLEQDFVLSSFDWHGIDHPILSGNSDALCRALERYRGAGVQEMILPDIALGSSVDRKKRTLDALMREVITRIG